MGKKRPSITQKKRRNQIIHKKPQLLKNPPNPSTYSMAVTDQSVSLPVFCIEFLSQTHIKKIKASRHDARTGWIDFLSQTESGDSLESKQYGTWNN
jgi:hypothetical protein